MKASRVVAFLLLIASVLALAAVVFMEVKAVGALGENYHDLASKELSEEERSLIACDDGLLIMLAYASTDTASTMASFLESSLRNIFVRILTAGVVYTAAVTTFSSLFLARRFGEKKGKHILSILLSGILVYLVFLAAVFWATLSNKLPLYLPDGKTVLLIILGLLAVLAGNAAFGLWMRHAKWKLPVAAPAVILVGVTYLFGSLFESGLYSPQTVDSFDYLETIEPAIFDEDYAGDAYFDETQNAVIVIGTAYPPKESPNPDHFTGLKRTGAILFEALDPYSPFALPLIAHAAELNIPPLSELLYFAKSLLWILLPALIGKKRETEK